MSIPAADFLLSTKKQAVIRYRLLLLILFFTTGTFARQPAYFLLGEEQFRGIQIYDIIQDQQFNYLFATNEGIFRFDYYTYEKIECEKARSSSVFSFVMNSEGVIYCHNLSNQVFEIKDGKCRLFYELQPNESHSDISLCVADNDKLVIGAHKIIVLDKTGKVEFRHRITRNYPGPAFVTGSGAILFRSSSSDSIIQYAGGKFSTHRLTLPEGSPQPQILHFYRQGKNTFALDLRTKALYRFSLPGFSLTPLPPNPAFSRSETVRIYETGEEDLWVAGALRGVALAGKTHPADTMPVYFEDYFISNVFRDHENNILLGTFDKGILVIPDLQVDDVIDAFRDDPVKALYGDSESGLMLGTSRGKLLQHKNGKTETIYDQGRQPVDVIYSFPGSDFIVFNDRGVNSYNKKTGKIAGVTEGALKDVAFVSKDVFYLGMNIGVFRTTYNETTGFVTEKMPGMSDRVYALEYNAANRKLYASTSAGFYVLAPSGAVSKITYRGEDIIPNHLVVHDGKIYANTQKNGILVIADNEVSDSVRPVIRGQRAVLKKMVIHQNTILASESSGFYRFDMQGNLLRSIHSVFGASSKRVIDFTFHNDQFWVSHLGGVQQVDLEHASSRTAVPVIRLNSIYCNDSATTFSGSGNFSSDQRKIRFVFSSPTLLNHESIRYAYKLDGYDRTWNSNPFENNEVTYNALAPGDYTFHVKAENEGASGEVVSYSFHIASPYYARWWFITLAGLLFLCGVYFIYRWQLQIQRKKSQQINELNVSKLTAIQSQMNPHFIFNSLNSIQDLILKGDIEQSYSYITTFSNLVRRTLSYSEKDFIDFEQEIKLLELYLSLEQLRFRKDLQYELHYTNVEDIMLPPLLIQPFIENALVHGLLHKEGEKKLVVRFELKNDLLCIIEDNGIGREKAKSIRMRQRSEHESFSGKAIRKRFDILSNVLDGKFGYTYEDLYQDGVACGTRVTLTIPVKHKF